MDSLFQAGSTGPGDGGMVPGPESGAHESSRRPPSSSGAGGSAAQQVPPGTLVRHDIITKVLLTLL